MNLGDGKFIDISGVAGLGFIQDGRAFSLLDLDQDGDLDMILKNRNAPQVRVLRNQAESVNHSVAFRLQGRQSNRDAVGAQVTLETAGGVRTKQVSLGAGFLSQSTKTLYFGLGASDRVERATIQWPSGLEQTFVDLPVDHHITVVEGEKKFHPRPFRPRDTDVRTCPPPQRFPNDASPKGIAMLNPVPIPSFSLKSLAGETVTSTTLEGRPTVLNFWATWCVPCQTEMKLWKKHYREIRAAGAELVALSVDEPGGRAQVEQFVRERQLPFPIWLMDASTLERFNLFYHLLFVRATDLAVPTTMLLDKRGHLVKIYHGLISAEVLLADVNDLEHNPIRLAQSALPYPGRRFGNPFFRSYSSMAASFYEDGLVEDTLRYLERAVELFPRNTEYWDRLGVLYAGKGEVQKALSAFQRSVAVGPNHASGYFNLALTLARLGRIAEAEPAFARAVELDPADPNKKLQHAVALAQNGKVLDAIKVMESFLEQEPNNAQAHYLLGRFYDQTNSPWLAIQQYQRATRLNPEFAEAFRRLGLSYLRQRMFWQAAESLERAVALNPEDSVGYFALGDAYASIGRTAEAIQMLERVLELQPGHTRAQRLLDRLRTSSHTGKRP